MNGHKNKVLDFVAANQLEDGYTLSRDNTNVFGDFKTKSP